MCMCNFTGRMAGDPVVATAEAASTVCPGLRRAPQCQDSACARLLCYSSWSVPVVLSNFVMSWQMTFWFNPWETWELRVQTNTHTNILLCRKNRHRHTCYQFLQILLCSSTRIPPPHPPTLERPQVPDGLIDYSIELWEIPMKALRSAVRRHGRFLAWPPCHDTELMLKTAASRIEKWKLHSSEQVHGFCIPNPYQRLVTASSSQAVPLFWKLKTEKSP